MNAKPEQHPDVPSPEHLTIRSSSGIELATRVWSGTETPIVLAHGGGQTHHSWGSTATTLAARGHRVLTYDLRGHGDSTWAEDGDYSNPAYGSDAVSIAEWLSEPVIWIGASLGGMSGLLATHQAPGAFAALVLVDITHRPALDGVRRILEFMQADIEHGFASLDDAADAVAAYQPHRKRPPDTKGLEKNLRLGEDGRWRWHWDPAFLRTRPSGGMAKDYWTEMDAATEALQTPTLLVRGQLSDLVTDAEVAAFRKAVPHANYVDVVDATHMIAGDKNDVFTSVILDFVAGLD